MTETALHGRVSEFGRARGRAFLKMAGHRPCFVYAWRRHCIIIIIIIITCEHQLLLAITDLLNIFLEGKTPISVRRVLFGANFLTLANKMVESGLVQWVIYGGD